MSGYTPPPQDDYLTQCAEGIERNMREARAAEEESERYVAWMHLGECSGRREDDFHTTHFGDDKEAGPNDVCFACLKNMRQLAIQECGHFGICFACAKKLLAEQFPRCPHCRRFIEKRLVAVICI